MDFYWSVGHEEFGLNTCPYIYYPAEIKVQNEKKQPLKNVVLTVTEKETIDNNVVVNNTVNETPVPKEENKNENKKEKVKKESKSDKNNKKTESKDNISSTQTFAELYGRKTYRMNILKLVKGKWKDAPSVPAQLEKFLKDRNVEVDSIGTSEKDIDAWMKTIEDCR